MQIVHAYFGCWDHFLRRGRAGELLANHPERIFLDAVSPYDPGMTYIQRIQHRRNERSTPAPQSINFEEKRFYFPNSCKISLWILHQPQSEALMSKILMSKYIVDTIHFLSNSPVLGAILHRSEVLGGNVHRAPVFAWILMILHLNQMTYYHRIDF